MRRYQPGSPEVGENMKKVYSAPTLAVEVYALDACIAMNCGTIVKMGPGDMSHEACDYDWGFQSLMPGLDVNSTPLQTSFYEDSRNCNCYYSAGNEGYWTS